MSENSAMTVHAQDVLEHNLTEERRSDDEDQTLAEEDLSMVSASGFAMVSASGFAMV